MRINYWSSDVCSSDLILPQAAAQAFWDSLRDQTHPFFLSRPLWRVAVPPQTAPLQVGPTLIEWNGGQRWVSQVGAAADFRAAIARRGGHATLFRFDSRPANVDRKSTRLNSSP